jgi:Ca2+-binding RTX toxin-like protein
VRRRLGFAAVMAVAVGLVGPAPFAVAALECHGQAATHSGTPGDDFLTGTPGVDVMVGLGGNDILDSLGGEDVLCGGDGQDLLIGGHGDDLLDGGQPGGDGTAYAAAPGPVVVDLAAGTATGAHGDDTLIDLENIFGSDFGDTLLGSAENNLMIPLGGDDVVDAREGEVDSIGYGLSPGPVAVTLEGGTAVGAEGSDAIAGIELVHGSDHDDYLVGDGHDNGLFGGNGHDTLFGRRGNDLLDGDAGNDYLSGGVGEDDFASYFSASGPVTVSLQKGQAAGAGGGDTLVAIEDVIGSHYDDRLVGDDADNVLIGNGGDDLLDGDAGLDWVSYFSTTVAQGVTIENPGPVAVDLAAGTGVDHSGGDQDTLVDLEAVLGSFGDDVIRGHGGEDILLGEDGDDLLAGRAGPDYMAGGPGDDQLLGGKGKRDAVSYSAGPAVTVDVAQGSATSAEGTDQLSSIEAVLGSDSGDTLRGDGARNWLFGGSGADVLFGRAGSDILDGEKGKDHVDGGAGTDYCLDEPNVRCEESDLPPAVQKALKQIKELESVAAKKKKGIKSFKKG